MTGMSLPIRSDNTSSTLDQFCKKLNLSRDDLERAASKTTGIFLLAIGCLFLVSGGLILSLTIPMLAVNVVMGIGAALAALGIAMSSFGIALLTMKRKSANEERLLEIGESVLLLAKESIKQLEAEKKKSLEVEKNLLKEQARLQKEVSLLKERHLQLEGFNWLTFLTRCVWPQ